MLEFSKLDFPVADGDPFSICIIFAPTSLAFKSPIVFSSEFALLKKGEGKERKIWLKTKHKIHGDLVN